MGGRFMTGFLVVGDGRRLSPNVASLHVSDFVKMVHSNPIGKELGLTTDAVFARVPFAFVWGPSLDPIGYWKYIIAPPFILERQDVFAWRLQLGRWPATKMSTGFLQNAIAAEPLR